MTSTKGSTATATVDDERPESTYAQGRVPHQDGATQVAVSSYGTPAVERARRDPLARRPLRLALTLVVPALVLLAWHLATAVTGAVPAHQLPAPGAVWEAGVDLAQRGELWTHIQISTQRVLLGFTIGSLVGLALGAVVGLSRLGDVLLSGTLGALRAVPSLAWVPLLIIWLKIGEDSKVTLIAIGAFFPVYTTVASALRHVDPQLVEAGRAYGLRGVRLLTRVQLPAATPAVVAGLRLALAQAWLFLVAAELIASSMGLGFLLNDSQYSGRIDRILLAIVLLAVLGKTTDALVGVAERRLLRRW
ncbi:ABC transporter permease [Cellulomonas sp. APG4]|uniref:ABC transporter permease n=1 Tax=Cellulomonas sp. APG4 TaxID=1538656 RepID=UPI00137B5A07|nr:ABC transporter permease [Cellulomonas sp. APG4]NCT91735.1 ABC transporter permease [Cellulomonas sp. APG4]